MTVPIRDSALLDALERREQAPFSGTVWRSVRRGRNPTQCWRVGGRWDDKSFDVLYASEDRDGAIEERRFHLFRGQPFPPSTIRYELFELRAQLSNVILFSDLEGLQSVGMVTAGFGLASYADKDVEYPRTQQIAEACFFMGADGIRVPNARHKSLNLIVFCEQDTQMDLEIVRNHGVVDWRKKQPSEPES